MNLNTKILVGIAVFVVIVLFGFAFFSVLVGSGPGIWNGTQTEISPQAETPPGDGILVEPSNLPLGGDRDEHGCIGSAGYSWCEAKAKCLRSWEEPCEESSVPVPTLSRQSVDCAPQQRNIGMCTKEFQPVCAKVQVQCIKAPCDAVMETYSNGCEACNNPLVTSYLTGGGCEKDAIQAM